jgi:hypothetical protein
MKISVILMMTAILSTGGDLVLIDFESKETTGDWYIVNDDVMGGVSRSAMQLNPDGTATFSGTLSPENYGGFASVRVVVDPGDEIQYKGVRIRLRGDGNIYSLRFRTNLNFDGYAYQAKVKSEKGEWAEYEVPFKDFEPTFRGRVLTGKPELDSRNMAQFGLLIADKQFGEFSVDVDWIKFYR